MNKSEQRSQKRKEVVEAVAVRNEPISVVACIFNITNPDSARLAGADIK